jgi:O-antigen/teichoic acid export membrane protein
VTARSRLSVRSALAWAVIGQYVTFGVQFGVSLYLARHYIGPDQLGLFSIAFAASAFIALFQDFGLTRYLVGAPEVTPDTVRTAATIATLLGLVIGLVIALCGWPLARAFAQADLGRLMIVLGGTACITPLALIPAAILQRQMQFQRVAVIDICAALAGAGTSLPLAASGHGAMSLAWGGCAQALCRATLGQIMTGGSLPWPPSWHAWRHLLRFGSGVMALNVTGQSADRAPDLIIGHILGEAATGLFSRAAGLSGQLRQLVSGAVTGVFYPAFAKARDRGDPLGPYYERVTAGYCIATWPAMAGLAVISQPLITMLFGTRWAGSADLATWLALSHMCFVALPLHIEIPTLLGRLRPLLWRNMLESVVAVVLLLIATQQGLAAAAAARFAYGLSWLCVYGPFLHRLIGFRWAAMARLYAQSLLATLVAIAPAQIGLWIQPEASLPDLLPLIALGVIAWALLLIGMDHPASAEFRGVCARVLRRRHRAP